MADMADHNMEPKNGVCVLQSQKRGLPVCPAMILYQNLA